jgi:hypothetical protein
VLRRKSRGPILYLRGRCARQAPLGNKRTAEVTVVSAPLLTCTPPFSRLPLAADPFCRR